MIAAGLSQALQHTEDNSSSVKLSSTSSSDPGYWARWQTVPKPNIEQLGLNIQWESQQSMLPEQTPIPSSVIAIAFCTIHDTFLETYLLINSLIWLNNALCSVNTLCSVFSLSLCSTTLAWVLPHLTWSPLSSNEVSWVASLALAFSLQGLCAGLCSPTWLILSIPRFLFFLGGSSLWKRPVEGCWFWEEGCWNWPWFFKITRNF